MNLEKFTDRAKGFLQSAQTVAIRINHQRIAPEHLLKALLEDSEGMAAGLIAKAGGDAAGRAARGRRRARRRSRRSRAAARSRRPALDNDLVRLLDQAEQIAQEGGRQLTSPSSGCCSRCALRHDHRGGQGARRRGRQRAEALNAAIIELRGGRTADTASRRGPLRRAQEIRARPHRGGARRQARSGDRPRRGDPPHHPDPRAAHQEQSRADRRARRRQDRDRRRASRCASPMATCPTRSRTAG